jgi:hypothetical protein
MPTTQIIDGRTVTIYSPEERADGITKSRLAASIALVQSGKPPHADDAAYVAFVCESAGLETLPDYAADSYADQFSGKTIAELEKELADAIIAAEDKDNPPTDLPTPTVNNVPVRVTRRQAKNVMELTPHPAGNLWLAALAAAAATPDAQARIVTTNYLTESLYFEREKVQALAVGLMGMTEAQVDQLMIAASKT